MQYICNFVLVQYYCLKIQKFLVSSNVLQFCYLSYFSIIRNLMLTSEPKDHNLSVSKLQAVELMFLFIESFWHWSWAYTVQHFNCIGKSEHVFLRQNKEKPIWKPCWVLGKGNANSVTWTFSRLFLLLGYKDSSFYNSKKCNFLCMGKDLCYLIFGLSHFHKKKQYFNKVSGQIQLISLDWLQMLCFGRLIIWAPRRK